MNRVFTGKLLAALGAVLLWSTASAQTAANDCSSAAAAEYPVYNNTCFVNAMNSTNNSNTLPSATCNATNQDDAWAWFTATGTSTTVTYFPDTRDAVLHVFSGGCGVLTLVACADDFGAGTAESVTFVTTAGTDYQIRIQRFNSNANMTGDLCIVNNCAPAPANDDPCNATAIPTPLNGVASCLTGESNACAAPDWTGGCVVDGFHTVWYTATLTGSNNVMDIDITNTTFGGSGDVEVVLAIKNDVCPADANMTIVGSYCGAPGVGNVQFTGLTAGQQYHIMINTANGEDGDFDLCVTESAAVIGSGNTCAAAISVSCGDALTGESTNTNTDTENGWTCGAFTYSGGDRFYVIQWPDAANGGSVRIALTNVTDATGTLMEVAYIGTSCTNPTCTEMNQFDITAGLYTGTNSNAADFNVPAGIQNHYFVVDDQNDGVDSYDIEFTCFATGIQLDVSNSCGGGTSPCNWRLDKFDSFGDGWQGGTADFFVNGVNGGPYAAAGFETLTNISVATGDNLQLDYTSGGGGGGAPGYEAENTMILRDGRGVIQHFEVPNMTTGTIWTGTSTADQCAFDNANPDEGIYQTWNGSLAPATADPANMPGTYTVCENLYLENPAGFEWLKDVVITVGDCWTNVSNITPNGTNTGYYNVDGDWAGSFNAGTSEITYTFTNSNDITWGDGNNGTAGYTCNLYQFCYDAEVDPTCSPLTGFRNSLDATDDGIGGGGGSTGAANVNLTQTSPTVNVLPVDLIYFDAKPILASGKYFVELKWETASEKDNHHFRIERSKDGINFEQILAVPGAGNSNTVQRYTTYDTEPLEGISYYRLVQVDFDGVHETFSPVAVEINYGPQISLSPQPATNEVTLSIQSSVETQAQISIYDAAGKRVEFFLVDLVEGVNKHRMDLTRYRSGAYILHFRMGADEYREKLLIR